MNPELVMRWVESAYASMGQRPPTDFEEAFATCIHWMLTGKIAKLEDWVSYIVTPEELNDKMFMEAGATVPEPPSMPMSFNSPEARQLFDKLVTKAARAG